MVEPKILYNLGPSAITGPSFVITLFLTVVVIGCVVIYTHQRRTKTLQPESRVVLFTVIGLAGGTALMIALSALPDLAQPPIIERGRVMRLYQQPTGAEGGRVNHVVLSSGADLVVDDLLMPKLQTGTCVEMTRTPATKYVLVAKQLPLDGCIQP